jgi:protein TonB
MIRHSKSLFASLTLHSAFLILIFLVWQNWPEKKKEVEKKICLKMCHLQEQKIAPKKVKAIVKKPKVVPPPPQKKIQKPKPKPKPKKKPKKKIVKKKIKPKPKLKKRTVPLVKKVPKKPIEEKIIEKKIEPIPLPIVREEPIVQKVVQQAPQETQVQKSKRLEQHYLDKNLKKIVRLLRNNLYYPRSARKRGITGKVMVKFKLLTNGNVEYVKVTSSNSKILTRAAIKTINNLSGDFPKPKEALTLHVPINYALN